MNYYEEMFKRIYSRRMERIVRPSWPDFLCITKDGELIAVEVKGGKDEMFANQLLTFDLLEEHSALKIKVWRREFPNQLWRLDQAKELKPWIASLRKKD